MTARIKARNKSKGSRSRRNEFLLARLGKGCWVVGYQGRVIAGAVLSSLPAAAAYAADLAHAFGSHNFLLTVVEAESPSRLILRAGRSLRPRSHSYPPLCCGR